MNCHGVIVSSLFLCCVVIKHDERIITSPTHSPPVNVVVKLSVIFS
jgi:hypothetical protein